MITYKSINQQNRSLEEREVFYKNLHLQEDEHSVLLQTCNRIELYNGDGDVPDEVARHLFRVVSGLESALIGERAVQGQVKEAYQKARLQHHLPASMHKLFEYALLVGKRVRNETEISHGAVSHSLAAIEIIEDEHVNLDQARITIIGVNKLTEDILKFLKNKGAKMVFLANRSIDKARKLAATVGYDVCPLSEKRSFLQDTDILISATSAPHLIVKAEDINNSRPLFAIDLAFPRDIDPVLADMPHVQLYNITDVEQRVKHNINVRQNEVDKAEQIIEEEIDELQDTLERRKSFLRKAVS